MRRMEALGSRPSGGVAVAVLWAETAVSGVRLGEEACGVQKLGYVAANRNPTFACLTWHIESKVTRQFSDSATIGGNLN